MLVELGVGFRLLERWQFFFGLVYDEVFFCSKEVFEFDFQVFNFFSYQYIFSKFYVCLYGFF